MGRVLAIDEVLIPVQADYLATKGVKLLLDSSDAVTGKLNPRLHVTGILLTLADQRLAHTREVMGQTRTAFATLMKMKARMKEAPITGTSILTYEPADSAAVAYRALAEEVEHAN